MSVAEARLALWRVLAESFLDVENDQNHYRATARTILASGFSQREVESILWHEVYPAVSKNLLAPLGQWQPWPDEWLLQHLRPSPVKPPPRWRLFKGHVQQEWSRIEAFLPDSYV